MEPLFLFNATLFQMTVAPKNFFDIMRANVKEDFSCSEKFLSVR